MHVSMGVPDPRFNLTVILIFNNIQCNVNKWQN